eukprot:Skav207512  [mRNA]  locus=scaffold907:38148:38435:+ [translate_table: standard]
MPPHCPILCWISLKIASVGVHVLDRYRFLRLRGVEWSLGGWKLFTTGGVPTAVLRLLQEFDDFAPQGLLHRLVHIVEGLMLLLDVVFDCIGICLD